MAQSSFKKSVARLRAKAGVPRHRLEAKIDAWRGYPWLRQAFREAHGYEVNLEKPRRFEELLQWRKVHDRDPFQATLVDKVEMPRWAKTRLPADLAERAILEPLCVVDDAHKIPFDELPDEYVMKSNNASDGNIFVTKDNGWSREQIYHHAALLMTRDYFPKSHEWAYSQVPKRLLCEPFLRGPGGEPPIEVKFFMFDGVCDMIQYNRTEKPPEIGSPKYFDKSFFDPDWKHLDAQYGAPRGKPAPVPPGFEQMLEIASIVSKGISFVRVDYLIFGDRYVLSEMTLYPGSGFTPIKPDRYGDELGAKWLAVGPALAAKSAAGPSAA